MSIRRSFEGILILFIAFLTSCAIEQVSYKKDTSVAVWDLENMSPTGFAGPDMGELLSAKVIETLRDTGDYIVVEREQLVLVLEELGLGTTALADEATRLRLGRLVGARLMVFGGYQIVGDKMRLDIRLVEVETGRVLNATQKTTLANDLAKWLRAAEEATIEVFQ